MRNPGFWRGTFIAASGWNLGACALGLLCYEFSIDLLFGTMAGPESFRAELFFRFFVASVGVFGLGYFMVARKLEANRDIVWLGLFAKLVIFVTVVICFIQGLVTHWFLGAAIGDFLWSFLFIAFLVNRK